MNRPRPWMPSQPPPSAPAQRFSDKSQTRDAIWKALVEHKAARFPFPLKGRIPNFDGADRAAALFLEHAVFGNAKCVKVNPDSPQRYVRKGLLDRGATVITPTPRLQGGFYRLDPGKIPKEHYWDAASMKMGGKWGEALGLDQLPHIDAIVMGCVAVTRDGRRLGKGHGYADLEYAILRELGHPPVPIATTVHACRSWRSFRRKRTTCRCRSSQRPQSSSRSQTRCRRRRVSIGASSHPKRWRRCQSSPNSSRCLASSDPAEPNVTVR